MGKIPLELARKRGARVKLLLSEHSMTQAELAEKIPCSAEHLSAVLNGKRGMTEEMARTICNLFSPTRIGWILGDEDYRDTSTQLQGEMNDCATEAELLHRGLFSLAILAGYKIQYNDYTIDNGLGQFFKGMNEAFTIEHEGQQLVLSLAEMNDFENEIYEEVELRLRQLFRKKKERAKNG